MLTVNGRRLNRYQKREVAVYKAPERAVSVDEYHVGAGWYEIRGEKVRGREAALEALREEE